MVGRSTRRRGYEVIVLGVRTKNFPADNEIGSLPIFKLAIP